MRAMLIVMKRLADKGEGTNTARWLAPGCCPGASRRLVSSFLCGPLAQQVRPQVFGPSLHAYVEASEQTVHGARFVVAHLRHDFLQGEGVVREQRHAPL